jgi:hypothetical protein
MVEGKAAQSSLPSPIVEGRGRKREKEKSIEFLRKYLLSFSPSLPVTLSSGIFTRRAELWLFASTTRAHRRSLFHFELPAFEFELCHSSSKWVHTSASTAPRGVFCSLSSHRHRPELAKSVFSISNRRHSSTESGNSTLKGDDSSMARRKPSMNRRKTRKK